MYKSDKYFGSVSSSYTEEREKYVCARTKEYIHQRYKCAHVAQLAVGKGFKIPTVWVRIPPCVPNL